MSNNPFDELFDQISTLLQFVKECSQTPLDEANIPPDFEKRLEKLRRKVDKFNKLSEEVVNLSGVSQEELKMRLNGVSKELPTEGKQLIERSQFIKSQAQDYNDELEKALKSVSLSDRSLEAKTDRPKEKIMDDKEFAKKRKSKFKRFGGDQNWKPL